MNDINGSGWTCDRSSQPRTLHRSSRRSNIRDSKTSSSARLVLTLPNLALIQIDEMLDSVCTICANVADALPLALLLMYHRLSFNLIYKRTKYCMSILATPHKHWLTYLLIRSPVLWTVDLMFCACFFFFLFFPTHFFRRLQTDIFEPFPHDVALLEKEALLCRFHKSAP